MCDFLLVFRPKFVHKFLFCMPCTLSCACWPLDLVQSSSRANFVGFVCALFFLLPLYLRWCEMKFPELCCVYSFFTSLQTEHQLNIHTKRSHIEYCATLESKTICNGIEKELELAPYTIGSVCFVHTRFRRIRIQPKNYKNKTKQTEMNEHFVYLSMRSSATTIATLTADLL